MECLEKVLQAWCEFAPDVVLGGVALADFETKVNASRNSLVQFTVKENEVLNAPVKRETDDWAGMSLKSAIVYCVLGDPNFGPDSSLYKAMGYIRKSDGRWGLTQRGRVLA